MVTDLSLSIEALRERIVRGELSATSICEAVLARIEERDPTLGAMCDVIAASALKEAARVDQAVIAGESPGPLAGIPVAVKNNIDTVPALCSAGLPHLSEYRPQEDAEVVARLRRAGAVIVGSTITDSGGFGVTSPDVTNPGFPERIAGGSSGGSAAAVAAGFCKAALGTDTGGSVRIPAACCGIFGFKPTLGRVSTEGVRPLARSIDHVGVLALSVGDVRSVMEVIDPGFTSLSCPGTTRSTVPRATRPTAIGIAKTYVADASPLVAASFGEFVKRCIEFGCTVREVDLPRPEDILGSHLVLSLTEAALFHLDNGRDGIHTLPVAARDSIELGLGYRGYEHLRALREKEHFLGRMRDVFSQVDFVALPTMPVPAPHLSTSTVRVGGIERSLLEALIRYTAPFDHSGHPALAMPWRPPRSDDVTSVQLIGPLDSDRRLLAFAESLKRRINGFGHPETAQERAS